MGPDDFHHDIYDSYSNNFISRSHLESPLDDLGGFDLFSKKNNQKRCYYQNDSFYAPTYTRTTNSIHDGQSGSPSSSPSLSCIDEPWSPASGTTETDDDASLASSISLSPNSDLDTFSPEQTEDEDDDYYAGQYNQYPSMTPDERDPFDDDDLSPLTFSPPTLQFLSPSEPGDDHANQKSTTHKPLFQLTQYDYQSFSDYDSSMPVPSSPSRRRSATLPELEPTPFNADLFGLHKSIPEETTPLRNLSQDVSEMRWYSFPGSETDDDLIPLELASKNYVPDPSIVVPSTSPARRSLLLWDHDDGDRSDIPLPRSPSPENIYLDPTILAECGDEELRKVYELRQRTAKSEKWERERCRELSALLRLKLDERGVLGTGEGGDYSNHQSGSRSLSCYSSLPFSSSPSSDSPTVYQPQPGYPSSASMSSSASSSTQNSLLIPSTSSSRSPSLPLMPGKPQSEGPKHKIRSMAQLVASMLFHRQSDTLRRHPSRKAGFEAVTSHSSHFASSSISASGSGIKVPPTPRSRLSTVILSEEMEMDSEGEGQGMGVGGEIEDEVEGGEDMNVDLNDGSLSRSCSDMDLDDGGTTYGNNGSHTTVTWTAPPCTTRERSQ